MTVRKITAWGNSLGIRLPQEALKELNLSDGKIVDVVVEDNKIILLPIKEEYTLEELLENITLEMQHDEIDLDEAVGNEIW